MSVVLNKRLKEQKKSDCRRQRAFSPPAKSRQRIELNSWPAAGQLLYIINESRLHSLRWLIPRTLKPKIEIWYERKDGTMIGLRAYRELARSAIAYFFHTALDGERMFGSSLLSKNIPQVMKTTMTTGNHFVQSLIIYAGILRSSRTFCFFPSSHSALFLMALHCISIVFETNIFQFIFCKFISLHFMFASEYSQNWVLCVCIGRMQ